MRSICVYFLDLFLRTGVFAHYSLVMGVFSRYYLSEGREGCHLFPVAAETAGEGMRGV